MVIVLSKRLEKLNILILSLYVSYAQIVSCKLKFNFQTYFCY